MAQLWVIERDVAGWTEDELQAAGIRAKMCVRWYADMEWVRSFYDIEGARSLCVYRADNEQDIRRHSLASGLPCGVVLPVEEVLPSDVGGPAPEAVTVPSLGRRASPLSLEG